MLIKKLAVAAVAALALGSTACELEDGNTVDGGTTDAKDLGANSQEADGGVEGGQGVGAPEQRDRGGGRQGNSELPSNGNDFVMPETAGMDLQLAQDTLQSVSGNPLFYSESVDATGAGRGQWWDSGWQVCWSEPAAGEVVRQSDTPTFAVVRMSENCP